MNTKINLKYYVFRRPLSWLKCSCASYIKSATFLSAPRPWFTCIVQCSRKSYYLECWAHSATEQNAKGERPKKQKAEQHRLRIPIH